MDEERLTRIGRALAEGGLDALVLTLPENVLMATGYWPVVGTAVAVATPGGTVVLAPEDEVDLAAEGFAEVRTYAPGSLHSLEVPSTAIVSPLTGLLSDLGLQEGRIGREDYSVFSPTSYAAGYRFGYTVSHVLRAAAPRAHVVSGSTVIAGLRSRLTRTEVDAVRAGCDVAAGIWAGASRDIRPGVREPEVAAAFYAPLLSGGLAVARRSEAFVWCMSGPNSARAGAAYARTRDRVLGPGDLVLVHCNSTLNGYWTDITRTYVLGRPDSQQRAMYDAIFAAREAALRVIRPGLKAAAVDAAAREVIEARGFGQYFTHGLGHNLGFSAISGEFPPRLHPASPDVLEVGSTFNVEPSIYIPGYGGIRHCDVVTVTGVGAELLTPFEGGLDDLIRPL